MLQKIRELGATPILVTQASMMCRYVDGRTLGSPEIMTVDGKEMNGLDFCRLKSLVDKETISACREAGGICIDLAAELNLGEPDFYDYYHNTPRGAARIGHFLYSRLKDACSAMPRGELGS